MRFIVHSFFQRQNVSPLATGVRAKRNLRRMLFLFLFGPVSLWCSTSFAEPGSAACGDLNINSVIPWDYRTDRNVPDFRTVEIHHFAPAVEALVKGGSGGLGGDLSFVLRRIPNHHRALVSLVKYGERWKNYNLEYSVECYFDRAVRFRPDDTVVRGLYAQYLERKNRRAEGIRELDAAVDHAGNNAFSHYNIGLVYLELGQFDKALAQARRAKELGFERPDLENRLKRAGKWQERPASAPSD
jgi:tetratricopeptide (TPR) repeat protein